MIDCKDLRTYDFKPIKLKKSDFKKLFFRKAELMEQFLKDKGLYQEFYDKCILPEISIDSNLFVASAYNGDLQANLKRPYKSYNEYIKEHFKGVK